MEIQKRLDNTSGIDSARNMFASANMETAKLLTAFPNEIWLQILERVFDPNDLHHLYISSQFFKNLLKAKALFHQVIKILFTKHNSAPEETWAILLNCRSVCRTWERGVDSILHNLFEYQKLLDRPNTKNIPNNAATQFRINTEKFLQHFDANYATSNRSPFFCKSVRLYYLLCGFSIQVITPQVLSIFEMYGHHISRFSVTYTNTFPTTPEGLSYVWLFERLPQFLNLMPNLKVLELGCPLESNISKDELEDLELSMQSCAFPALNHLRHLSLQNFPTPIFDAVLRNYSHVIMLSLCPIMTNRLSFYVQPMPNLTQLELVLQNSSSLIPLEITNIKWPLTTLLLRIDTAVFDWEKLFRILENRWASTLTEIKIDADYFWKHAPLVLPSLKLPNLKLFLMSSKQVIPLDFILPMANTLERLVVRYCSRYQVEPEVQNEQVIKFFALRENLINSNIWTLFPKLKIVEYYESREVRYVPHRQIPIVRRIIKRIKGNSFKTETNFPVPHEVTNYEIINHGLH